MKHLRLTVLAALLVFLPSCAGSVTGEIKLSDTFASPHEITFGYNGSEYALLVGRENGTSDITVLGEGTLAGTVIVVCGDRCVISQHGLDIEAELSSLPGETFYGALDGIITDICTKKPAITKNEAGEYEYSGMCGGRAYTVKSDSGGKVKAIYTGKP